jgi:hypothetical protein
MQEEEFDVIVARHMDRLLRGLSELESTLEHCQRAGVAIVTASDGVDTSTDGGRLVARILSSVAQGEVERKGSRQRSAAIQAAKQGRWVGGRRPFGYEKDGVTIRETEATMIKQAYADILAGESLSEVARWVTPPGVTQLKATRRWYAEQSWISTNPGTLIASILTPEEVKIRQNPNSPVSKSGMAWRSSTRQPGGPRCGSSLTRAGIIAPPWLRSVDRGGAVRGLRPDGTVEGPHTARRCRASATIRGDPQPVVAYVMAGRVRLQQPDASSLVALSCPTPTS